MKSLVIGLMLVAMVTLPRSDAAAQLTGFIFRSRDSAVADTLLVYADGNLRNAIAQNQNTTVAAGALGVGLRNRTVLLDLLINAAGSSTPIRANHASTLLVPGSGGSLSAGYGELRYRPGTRLGLRTYASVSSSSWTDTLTDRTVSTLVGGIGVGGFVNLFGGTVGERMEGQQQTVVGSVLDIGLAWRTLGGDIVEGSNETQLTNMLGSSKKNRVGLEIALTLQVNSLTAGFTYYLFGGDVPGFSKGQVVAGFSISTPLIKGAIQ
jgi:hypothetical protein